MNARALGEAGYQLTFPGLMALPLVSESAFVYVQKRVCKAPSALMSDSEHLRRDGGTGA